MAASSHEAGSQTSSGTTEHTLNTTDPDLTDGAFQLWVDLATMVDDDIVTLRIYEKVENASGTQRLIWAASYKHTQAYPAVLSPPLILLFGWKMTLQKEAGSNTAFPWNIRLA